METEAHTTLSPASLMAANSMTPEPVFKMEDLTLPITHCLSVTKPVKKRKSWGQELPEPKTALPPRKRAKTDDEKEQRRIERIKRNRAAAHNSRERKRVEAEHLAVENAVLVQEKQALQRRLARHEALLAKCRELLPNGLPELTADEYSFELPDQSSSTSPSSSYTIDPRASLSTPATTPADSTIIKIEDIPATPLPPPASSDMEPHHFDVTQHSAAMLCDLQCPSNVSGRLPLSPQSILQTWWWTQVITYLMHMTIMTTYKSLLMALWTLSPARMTRLLTTTTLSPTSSTLTRRLRQHSTFPQQSLLTTPPSWATLAQLLFATGQLPLGSSAPALTRGHRDVMGKSITASLMARGLRRLTDDNTHDDESDSRRTSSLGRVDCIGERYPDLG